MFAYLKQVALPSIQCIWKWNEYLMKKAHSWKVVFFNIREWKASLMKLALKMKYLKHSWKIVFLNIHECTKPKIIKVRVINTWTKDMENQRPKKQWFLKFYLKIDGLTCIELDCEHLSGWISASEVIHPFVRHCHPLCCCLSGIWLEWVSPFHIQSLTMSSWWSSFVLAL